MSTAVKIIGSIILSLLIYSIPILTTCSFIYNWHGEIQFFLCFASVVEVFCILAFIYDKAEED